MSQVPFIQSHDVEHRLTWRDACEALRLGHGMPRADIDDASFTHGHNTLLNRTAWIRGLGIGVKSVTVFPGNPELSPPLPSVHTVFTLFDDSTGEPVAIIDGAMVTRWKTAADSVLGAQVLARPDSRSLLVIGAGVVAHSLVEAYTNVFPDLELVSLWNRTHARAEELAERTRSKRVRVQAVENLRQAIRDADIVSSATLSTEPLIRGDWVRPGAHVDLIGSYRADMRESDDALIGRSKLFVDSRETAIRDTGDLAIPINNGVITTNDIGADLYDLCAGARGRASASDITVYKNGGGAHLDLMTAGYIFSVYQQTG